MGYYQAGFKTIVGVDIVSQPNYPFDFIKYNALEFDINDFDVVHASPPCQAYCSLSKGEHPDLISEVRNKIENHVYVIENVPGAPLKNYIKLCGSMFGLNVRRHRHFESGILILGSNCNHKKQKEIRAYYGKKGWPVWTPAGANVQKFGRKPLLRGSTKLSEKDMGINWMTWDELRESIPPAYTKFIGIRLINYLKNKGGNYETGRYQGDQ